MQCSTCMELKYIKRRDLIFFFFSNLNDVRAEATKKYLEHCLRTQSERLNDVPNVTVIDGKDNCCGASVRVSSKFYVVLGTASNWINPRHQWVLEHYANWTGYAKLAYLQCEFNGKKGKWRVVSSISMAAIVHLFIFFSRVIENVAKAENFPHFVISTLGFWVLPFSRFIFFDFLRKF